MSNFKQRENKECLAIKRIDFDLEKKIEIIRKYFNYSIISQDFTSKINICSNILMPGLKKELTIIYRNFDFTLKWDYAIKY
jgi:hypothetical protein